MEAEFNHLNHATWECKYHVVFTPKYRKKLLFGKIKRHLGQVFHDLARRKECRIEEGHLMPDHVHMLISIPPKYSVAQIIGYMKGKSSIWIAQNVERKMRNFLGHKFWARGYFVTTVGRDEEVIRAYIRNQELADRQLEQFELKISAAQNPINRPNIPYNRFGGSQSNLQLCWRLLAIWLRPRFLIRAETTMKSKVAVITGALGALGEVNYTVRPRLNVKMPRKQHECC